MDRGIEPRVGAPLIHGRMIYRCECCGKSWPMYLEKGIEEFGENHKPSPFTIVCPYCGGLAMDVSGIQKVPGGGYVPLPDGYGYFANVEGRDCGVPTFPPLPTVAEKAAVGKAIEIIIADEIDGLLREWEMELELEAIAGYGETEAQEILKAAREMALWKGCTLEEIIGAIMNAVAVGANPKKGRRAFADFKTAWDRKEARGETAGRRAGKRLPVPAEKSPGKYMGRAEEDRTAQAGMAWAVERNQKNKLTRRRELCGART